MQVLVAFTVGLVIWILISAVSAFDTDISPCFVALQTHLLKDLAAGQAIEDDRAAKEGH